VPFFVYRLLEPRRVLKRTSRRLFADLKGVLVVFESTGQAWEIRAARNQALFRAINDELRGTSGANTRNALTIACECADVDCVETIDIDVEEYKDIRLNPTHFAVLAGHIYPEVERVLAERPAYVVVEKMGDAARVAAAADRTREDA